MSIKMIRLSIVLFGFTSIMHIANPMISTTSSEHNFYLSQPTVATLNAVMNDFLIWTERNGAQAAWTAWQKVVDSGIYESVAFFPTPKVTAAFEKIFSAQVRGWFNKQHEIRFKHLSIEESECCNIVYTCAVKAFISAAWFLGGNEARSSKIHIQRFVSTVQILVQEFIVAALDACAGDQIDSNTKEVCLAYFDFISAMLGRNINERVLITTIKLITVRHDQISRLEQKIHKLKAFSNPMIQQTYLRLIALCEDFRKAWIEWDNRWVLGKIIHPISPKFDDIYVFRNAYKDVLKDGFYQLLGIRAV
ncbi:MAG: hypothetical protein WCW33_02900 [Candidatus Babeliales bacterium]|jgi:hypothetical protein